jgi:eukaryotic translation initiation factor 2C
MNGHALVIGTVFQSDDFEYIQPNGMKVPKLRADVTYTASLTDIEAKLRKNDLADLPEYIRALNANVAQCVVQHASNTGKQVSRVGANKFFLDKGYVRMHGGLRAARGYLTSIRPGTEGTLLNINAATSAFLPPVTVADFARDVTDNNMKRLPYASQLLHGATVRILYRRQCYENGVDYNSNQAQLKLFTHFGDGAKKQTFYRLLKTEKDEPKKTDLTDNGKSVYDYFTKGVFNWYLLILCVLMTTQMQR